MKRVTRKVENMKSARRATKNEGSDARVKKELINLVKDGTVTWEELARACVYWMDNDTAWSVVAELGEGADDDYDDDMIDDSQDAEDFDMPDWDKADAEDEMDECDQSRCSALESRIRRLEQRLTRSYTSHVTNESALPNGITPRTVGDVLSYYVAAKEGVNLADVSKNKAYVIDYLMDNGDLARIKNSSENRRFFSSINDVEDALWGCWDDNLNAWNDSQMKAKTGLAKLFGPDPSSGIFRLTVYPINGRGGRNRTLEIILTWPMY